MTWTSKKYEIKSSERSSDCDVYPMAEEVEVSSVSSVHMKRTSHHGHLFDKHNTKFEDIPTTDAHRNLIGAFIAVVAEGLEYIRQRRMAKHDRFVVLPGDSFRKLWDLVTIVMLFYSGTSSVQCIHAHGRIPTYTDVLHRDGEKTLNVCHHNRLCL